MADDFIITKVCTRCGVEKDIAEFYRMARSGDGHQSDCKKCNDIRRRANSLKNKEREKIRAAIYRQNNKEKIKAAGIEWRKNNPEKVNATYAKYRKTEKRRIVARNWARRNRKTLMKRFVERYSSDPQFNLAIKLRRRIYMAVRNQFTVKAKKTIDLLGITYLEFKEYIESKFTEGMSWEKVLSGEIHLDHIKPVSLFDLSNEEEQVKAFNYKNMQPLWAYDNLKKHNKY